MLKRLPRLRSGRAIIHAMLDDPGTPVALLDAGGRVLEAGAAYQALTGTDQADCAGTTPPFAPAAHTAVLNALRDQQPLRIVTDLILPAGPCPVTVNLTPTGLHNPAGVLRLTDMRPQRQTEEKLAQSQRLQAVGQLAAGIAHDFNNLLTAILGATEALAPHMPEAAGEDLTQIRASAERGAALIRQLLAFGRQQTLQPQIVALNDAVGRAAGLLRRLLGQRIKLELVLDDPGRLVRIDPTQLDQVLMNLAVNARDAMLADPASAQSAVLTITTGRRMLLTPETDGMETIPAGRYATIEVRDTGPGIPPEVLPHIFEPFFTTKREEGGTGLGLSTVHGIIRQSGGYLAVMSTPGAGTVFRITLPRHENSSPTAPPPEPTEPVRGKGRRLLLVEDEAPVRRLAARALSRVGWEVIEAATPAAALAADLCCVAQIVSDVIMPGMDGPALVRAVRQVVPGMPALLVSGYADAAQRRALQAEDIRFLAKPFAMAKLVELVGTPTEE